MLISLFGNLGKRLYNENNLSDMTWAMAKSNTEFMKCFMEFFDFHDFTLDVPWDIRREQESEGNRPDFTVNQGVKQFIIENKIGDTNYHFPEYAEQFPAASRAFISDYNLGADGTRAAASNGFCVRTWQQFIDCLKDAEARGTFDKDNNVVAAYIAYVKEVCTIVELTKPARRIEQLGGLHSVTKLIQWTIKNFHKDGFTCDLYENSKYVGDRAFNENYSGQYAELTHVESNTFLYPLIGIWYDEASDRSALCIWFEKDWNGSLYGKYKDKEPTSRLYEYTKSEDGEEGSWLEFRLRHEKFIEFAGAPLEDQKKLLAQFLDAVVDDIAPFIR
jgi:hypothetical protein